MNAEMIERMARMVFALVEAGVVVDDEYLSYEDACNVLALTEAETAVVLALIDDDLG